MPDLSRLLAPRSVAVVGATDREGTYAHTTLLNLARAGFAGQVVGVHPTRSVAAGVPCVPTLADVDRVDAVVIATPADTVPGYVADAAALGCGGAVVYAAGFAEAGRADLQDDLKAAAQGMPVIGPNGNGLVRIQPMPPKGQNYDANGADTDNITPLVIAQLQPVRTWTSLLERSLWHATKLDRAAASSGGTFMPAIR